MRQKVIVERYAEAFVEYNSKAGGIDGTVREFKNLRKVIRDNPRFLRFLDNPGITEQEKFDFLDVTLKNSFSEEMRNFLKILVEKKRMGALVEITDYIRVKYSHGDVMDALIKTSYPMDTDLLKKLKEKLEAKFNKKLNVYLELDPTLLGGVKVTVKNTVLDGSLRHYLEAMRDRLNAVRAV